MTRFFVTTEDISDNLINIYGDDANHIKNVLRLHEDDIITVCDTNSIEYECKIEDIGKHSVIAKIISKGESITEPSTKITLFQSLPKSDKIELIIQKCVELGVYKIIPVVSSRTIVKLNSNTNKKIERWNKISEAAAKQSRRGIIPLIDNIMDFKTAVEYSKNYDLSFMPYELEEKNKLKSVLKDFKGNSMAVFIGPEGGFSIEEVELAKLYNIQTITLGKRILRTETAGLMVMSIAMYEKEEI